MTPLGLSSKMGRLSPEGASKPAGRVRNRQNSPQVSQLFPPQTAPSFHGPTDPPHPPPGALFPKGPFTPESDGKVPSQAGFFAPLHSRQVSAQALGCLEAGLCALEVQGRCLEQDSTFKFKLLTAEP